MLNESLEGMSQASRAFFEEAKTSHTPVALYRGRLRRWGPSRSPGRVRGLAVTSATRSHAQSDLPAVGDFVPGRQSADLTEHHFKSNPLGTSNSRPDRRHGPTLMRQVPADSSAAEHPAHKSVFLSGPWRVLGFDPFARAMAAPVRVPKSRVGAPTPHFHGA